jgi:hypothetical protein
MSLIDTIKNDLSQGENPELIQRVSKQNKNLKQRFDAEFITKQTLQTNLKEIYKPITDTQQSTTSKVGEQTTKTNNLFRQLLNDLQGKHDRTSMLLSDMIRGLARSNEETRLQGLNIISAIAKQPLLPELINELNQNNPVLVQKMAQSGNMQDLSDQDRKALEPLGHLNDNDLRTLVNYYVLHEKIKSSDLSFDEVDLGAVGEISPSKNTDDSFQENPINLPIYKETIKTLHKRKAGLNERTRGTTAGSIVSPTFYYDANDRSTVKCGNCNVLFKEDKIKIGDAEYTLTPGLELLLNRTNPPLDEKISNDDLKNYLKISHDSGFDYTKQSTIGLKMYNVLQKLNKSGELQTNFKVMGTGLNTVIIPDNVEELKHRLTLLLGEYSAGNKSMFNEINAVLDLLLKKKAITKIQFKNVLRSIKL